MSRKTIAISVMLLGIMGQAGTAYAYDQQLYDAIFYRDKGDAAKVRKLLAKVSVKVNAKGADGSTPLSDACYIGNFEIVKLLISNGADVNKADDFKNTPLMIAAMTDNGEKIVKYLIDHGANPHAVNDNGLTALGCAMKNDNPGNFLKGNIRILQKYSN